MKKRFMSKTMKIFLPLLLIFSIVSFVTSSVMLYKSDYKLTNYTQFEEFLYDIFGHDYLYFKNWLNTGNYESPLSQSFSLTNIDNIVLEFPNSYIEVSTGYTSNIEFDCLSFDTPTETISNSVTDGTLALTEGTTSPNTRYSIVIPEHFAGKITIKSKSGNISISNCSIDSLNISSYDSMIDLRNILSKEVSISNSNESIYLDSVTADSLRVSNVNSSIYIANCASNLDIKNSRGEISLNNLKNTNYNVTTDTGNVEIDLQHSNNFIFTFNTKSGLLENDLDVNEYTTENKDNTKIIKMNSYNSTINVTTNSGNLEISKDF